MLQKTEAIKYILFFPIFYLQSAKPVLTIRINIPFQYCAIIFLYIDNKLLRLKNSTEIITNTDKIFYVFLSAVYNKSDVEI